jgi:hypothetical protein
MGIVSILSLNSSYIWAGPKDWKNYNDLKIFFKRIKIRRINFFKKKLKLNVKHRESFHFQITVLTLFVLYLINYVRSFF